MTMIYLFLLFLGCHIYLEKSGLPQFLEKSKLRYILLGSIGIIGLSMILGVLLNIATFCVMTATVMASSLIAYKYRSKFEKMERGENV
ncbi:hypothetical protein ACWOB4_03635 [Enterococcus songbeiensis]